MSEARLATHVWVTALVRRVFAAGEFATIMRRGNEEAGSIALVHRARNGGERVLTRVIGSGGTYTWQVAASNDSVADWLARQQRYDPDLWVVELDTPDLARFVDDLPT